MKLNWIRCQDNKWCDFLVLNFDQKHFDNLEGVYTIWHSGIMPVTERVVRIGQGEIRKRLQEHKEDLEILEYQEFGLYVTWASVKFRYRDGIERYLSDELNPKLGARYPAAIPIEVNLPWD